ncbi:hypothetical protein [Salinicola rhizosphaerae]|uniref:Outer membrane protein assembly factor BamE n=1 Tax=Salinicola rhizosphaerae TaxID=1443141 RepID=A0ABQ3E935_9GAMM|nr:hypothetical protein [Salinicola rhizosphaerae]GHB30442.1 hypothetical protein GCM10009038_31530 [Salinicola rhizosphaerae]
MRTALIAIAMASLLAGCASYGNQKLGDETEASVATKIHENETTQADLLSMLGSPTDKSFREDGREEWTYVYSEMSADAVNFIPFVGLFGTSNSGTLKKLNVIFNENDTVWRYAMTESDNDVKSGVFK